MQLRSCARPYSRVWCTLCPRGALCSAAETLYRVNLPECVKYSTCHIQQLYNWSDVQCVGDNTTLAIHMRPFEQLHVVTDVSDKMSQHDARYGMMTPSNNKDHLNDIACCQQQC